MTSAQRRPMTTTCRSMITSLTLPPLFAFDAGDGEWSPMTKDFFLRCVKAIWANTDLAHIHSHSFRIGHTTELLLAGVPPEMVAALSSWSLLSFLLYWQKIEHIVPANVGKVCDKKKLDEVVKASKPSVFLVVSLLCPRTFLIYPNFLFFLSSSLPLL
jgi:hypothetical protein